MDVAQDTMPYLNYLDARALSESVLAPKPTLQPICTDRKILYRSFSEGLNIGFVIIIIWNGSICINNDKINLQTLCISCWCR